MRVLALESRRAVEIETLIRTRGGDAFVAPSMREIPLQNNVPAFAFMDRLLLRLGAARVPCHMDELYQ